MSEKVISELFDILDDYIGESTLDPKVEKAISLDILSYLAGAFPGKETSVEIRYPDLHKGAIKVTATAGEETWTLSIRADTREG